MSGKPSRTIALIVDERKLRQSAFCAFLEAWTKEHGLEIVTVETVDPQASQHRDECAICIHNVGGGLSNRRTLRTLKLLCDLFETTPVVVVSDNESVTDVVEAFRLGARGFIPTSMAPDLALGALSFVLAGGCFTPASILQEMIEPERDPPPEARVEPPRLLRSPEDGNGPASDTADDGPDDKGGASSIHAAWHASEAPAVPTATLTDRQHAVLELLRKGKANKEIARALAMSEATVKVHMRQVMRKLGANNRTEAALIASRWPPQDPSDAAQAVRRDLCMPDLAMREHGSSSVGVR